MANQSRGDATYRDFGQRAARRTNRSVEPKNGGPTAPAFVKVVGTLAKDGEVRGTVLKRLRRKEPA
ncbi:MAG: hypothetical protein ABJH45_10185 [Paracoccaceae bacterium]